MPLVPIEYAVLDVWTLNDLSLIFNLIHWQPCPRLPTEPGCPRMLCTPFRVNILPWFNSDFSFEKRVLSLENVGLFHTTVRGKTLATPLGNTLVVNGGEGRRGVCEDTVVTEVHKFEEGRLSGCFRHNGDLVLTEGQSRGD